MSFEYKIQITEEEKLVLEATTGNIQSWIDNAIHNRARIALSDMISLYVAQALQNNWEIPSKQIDLIKAAIDKNIIEQAPSVNAP
jgi:hypothetical protein